ncbi:MAG: helix-turn-helix domain-containing protein [Candidatus Gastranaerophilaceae bacterium]
MSFAKGFESGSGVDNSYISKLERKKVNITIDKMSIIAKALDVKVFELIK